MNPYWGSTFFEFFPILFSRFHVLLAGAPAEADEVQLGVLAAIALACGVIGPFLVLRRMAMFANSLSHTILLGIVLAFLFASKLWGAKMFSLSTLLIGSAAAALLTAFLTEGLVRFFRLAADASVGFVFSTLFALGILFVTLFIRNVHLGSEAIMGNVDALQSSDFQFAMILAIAVVALVGLFYRGLKLSSFDSHYGTTLGFSSSLFHFLLLFLASGICVGAFRAVGVLLVLAFLTGPYLSARLFSDRLGVLLWLSPAFGICASIGGVALSRHCLSVYGLPLSTGGIVVCVIGIFYTISVIFKFIFHDRIVACEKGSPS